MLIGVIIILNKNLKQKGKCKQPASQPFIVTTINKIGGDEISTPTKETLLVLLKTILNLLFIRNQSAPRCKHFLPSYKNLSVNAV
jgi:hypothetical protein